MAAVRRWMALALALSLASPVATSAADICSILMIQNGETRAVPYAGTQAGLDQAKTDCGAGCYIQIGPGGTGLDVGTIPAGCTIARFDSLGFTLYSKIVSDDSARFNQGIYVGGQFIPKVLRASAALDFDLTTVSQQDLRIYVPGVSAGDEPFVGVPSPVGATAGVVFSWWCSATDSVTVRATRTCDAAPTIASGTFKVTVFK